MQNDSFSQKEILLQLMTEMRETRKDIAEQRMLLQSHINASIGRDEKIAELTKQIIELTKQMSTVRTDLEAVQNSFAFFKFKVTFIASIIATGLGLLGQKVLATILEHI
jgi:hypothetical protein